MSTEELLAVRAHQLQKREEDLEAIKDRIIEAQKGSIREFLKRNQNRIRDFNCQPGDLVLVRNSAVESDLNRKTKPRFLGLFVVVNRTDRGAYILAELDGAVGKSPVAAFRVIPYFACLQASVPVAKIVGLSDPEIKELDVQEPPTLPDGDDEQEEEFSEKELDEEEYPVDSETLPRRNLNRKRLRSWS
jgi:hypothetical protein